MATTYEAIATVTVGAGGASNITFSSIPATYTDLVLKVSIRSDRTSASNVDDVKIAFNGVSTNQSARILQGNGSSASSATDTLIYGYCTNNSATANTFGNQEFYIPNYAGSNNKSISGDSVAETNGTTVWMDLMAGLWSSSSAINQITLTPYTGPNFMQYSTATLYGIKNS